MLNNNVLIIWLLTITLAIPQSNTSWHDKGTKYRFSTNFHLFTTTFDPQEKKSLDFADPRRMQRDPHIRSSLIG